MQAREMDEKPEQQQFEHAEGEILAGQLARFGIQPGEPRRITDVEQCVTGRDNALAGLFPEENSAPDEESPVVNGRPAAAAPRGFRGNRGARFRGRR